MRNFPIQTERGTFWVSRSVAVIGIVYTFIKAKLHILAVQRGEGTPDPEFVGAWCLPCGYLDYDETCEEAVCREVKEETGISLREHELEIFGVFSNPKKDKRQNVSIVYSQAILSNSETTNKFAEPNEVSDIKWIYIEDLDNYKWAFKHDELIKDFLFENY